MKNKFPRPVPVLMYHSVGIPNESWMWNHLTCPWEIFEDQLRALNMNGYQSINLSQLYDYIFHSKPIPQKSIVFTFDDGYLDNWVFAYPLMKKYGFHGTIYVNPEFVDENGGLRKRWDETEDISSLTTTGFLSWDEMRAMEKDRVMSIESHALTHTWYPKSGRIIDYRHPGDPYIWMTWNNRTDLKYKLQLDDESLVALGEPVYEHEKSLSGRRFFPDEGLKEHCCNFIRHMGGPGFFKQKNWKERLDAEVHKYKLDHSLNERYESEEEYRDRILYELQSTKSTLENNLDKEVWFHCWPGGSATKTGMEIADQLGFKLSNAANDILPIRYKIKNNNQFQINRINRFAPVIISNKNKILSFRYLSDGFFILKVNVFISKGIKTQFLKLILRIYKSFLSLLFK